MEQPARAGLRADQPAKTTVPSSFWTIPEAALLPESHNFVTLREPGAALRAGDCYIQDPSTALACEMLRPVPAKRCSTPAPRPAAKRTYLAEIMQNQGILVAADQDETRLRRLRDNLVRLGITNARTLGCDWSDEKSIRAAGLGSFLRQILLDAPCTNTGVMRRRVDVRWRLRPDDFVRMQRLQLAILRGLVPLLKPGGSLVYSTCSLEEEENEQVIEASCERSAVSA